MEKHCTSVYFMVKKTRKDKNGLSPIVVYISVNAVRVSYYTGKKIKVSDWDDEKQLVRGRSEEAKRINGIEEIRLRLKRDAIKEQKKEKVEFNKKMDRLAKQRKAYRKTHKRPKVRKSVQSCCLNCIPN